MAGVLPGHMDGVLPGHIDEVLPGHMNGVLPGHLDGVFAPAWRRCSIHVRAKLIEASKIL